jgi:mono/diheme cytochrome c family protein
MMNMVARHQHAGIEFLGRAGLLTLLCVAALSGKEAAADTGRGVMLHDTHCLTCHDTRVYKRGSKVAQNYDQVRAEVVRWQRTAALRWSDADIDAVAVYLAQTFYKLPCPVC